jgi:hypothetical protein
MGFLDALLKKGGKSGSGDGEVDFEALPKDPKTLQDLAHQKKAKGQTALAVKLGLEAAKAHKAAGFNQKAVAVLKSTASWDATSADVFELLASTYLEMKLKEDARGAFLTLKKIYLAERKGDEVKRIDSKIAELGPGR